MCRFINYIRYIREISFGATHAVAEKVFRIWKANVLKRISSTIYVTKNQSCLFQNLVGYVYKITQLKKALYPAGKNIFLVDFFG